MLTVFHLFEALVASYVNVQLAVKEDSAGQGPALRFLADALSSAFPYFTDHPAQGIYLASHKGLARAACTACCGYNVAYYNLV